jgi:hypothetical protein
MTQKTALRSTIPKDVMTSLFSLLTSHRGKIWVQFSTGFWQKKTLSIRDILWNFHRKNWWDIENFALMHKILPNPSRISVILWQEQTENNLRKWRVRYARCQRRVADKMCRFLINAVHIRSLWPSHFLSGWHYASPTDDSYLFGVNNLNLTS